MTLANSTRPREVTEIVLPPNPSSQPSDARGLTSSMYNLRLRLTGTWYWQQDENFRFTDVDEAVECLGQSLDAWYGKPVWDTTPLMAYEFWAEHMAVLLKHAPFNGLNFEIETDPEQHTTIWVQLSGEPLFDVLGRFVGYHGFGQEITVQKGMEQALRARELRLRAIFVDSPLGIVELDTKLRVRRWNPAAERIFGWTREEVLGRHVRLLSLSAEHNVYDEMGQALNLESIPRRYVTQNLHKDGYTVPCCWATSILHDDDGNVLGAISIVENLTDKKVSETLIEHMSRHDALTNLPNRGYLLDLLDDEIADGRGGARRPMALLALNLERFKLINDALGHMAGDKLLCAVAQRLRQAVPRTSIVARLSGDAFAVVLRHDGSARVAHDVAEKLLAALAQPYHIDDNEVTSTVSVGVALYPQDATDGQTLLHNADAALSHAKEAGRNQLRFFSASLREAVTARHEVERDLRQALRRGELMLHFQPQVRAKDGTILGAEALLRWNHPTQGVVAPITFVPVAESADLIVEIGAWVLDEACRTLRQWRDQGLHHVSVAINLSTYQLRDGALVGLVADALQRHGLQGQDLELELTETAAMEDPTVTVEVMHRLRDLNVQLAIDDFGIGYSSLSYLKLLPIQRLKLDQSFVKDIGANEHDDAICSATIALAHKLHLEVVAEGVSTEQQRGYLLAHGCDQFQGYLFGKPMSAQHLASLALEQTQQG